MLTSLGKENSEYKPVKLYLKNRPCVTSCLCSEVGIYIYIYKGHDQFAKIRDFIEGNLVFVCSFNVHREWILRAVPIKS